MANKVHGQLVADTVLAIENVMPAERGSGGRIEILNRDGAADIWIRYGVVDDPDDLDDPAVNGDGCDVLPAAIGSYPLEKLGSSPVTIKLLSHGTPKYSVIGASE